MTRALVTGITGQDGSHLADLLLAKGYEVHGLVRRASNGNGARIAHIDGRLTLHEGDLLDERSLREAITGAQPDEIYNLAAQSHVGSSFGQPVLTAEVTGLGPLRLLEAARQKAPAARFYQASSSEMFGAAAAPQSEATPFHPRSPYATAKAFAHHATVNYRESYGLHASCGILFNHEGERRSDQFVTRKVTRAVARIATGQQRTLSLGSLDARRDWGHAADYVEAMWLMLQQPEPGDYVIATGETRSVREFVQAAFEHADLDWEAHVRIDPALIRPAEVDLLCGDASRARERLGWVPRTGFRDLVARMVDHDLGLLA